MSSEEPTEESLQHEHWALSLQIHTLLADYCERAGKWAEEHGRFTPEGLEDQGVSPGEPMNERDLVTEAGMGFSQLLRELREHFENMYGVKLEDIEPDGNPPG